MLIFGDCLETQLRESPKFCERRKPNDADGPLNGWGELSAVPPPPHASRKGVVNEQPGRRSGTHQAGDPGAFC